jgi:hypothetical protein
VDRHVGWRSEVVARALDAPGIDLGGLWFAYLGLGGKLGRREVETHLDGRLALPPLEENLLAEAARELLEARRPLSPTIYGDSPDPKRHSPANASPTPWE